MAPRGYHIALGVASIIAIALQAGALADYWYEASGRVYLGKAFEPVDSSGDGGAQGIQAIIHMGLWDERYDIDGTHFHVKYRQDTCPKLIHQLEVIRAFQILAMISSAATAVMFFMQDSVIPPKRKIFTWVLAVLTIALMFVPWTTAAHLYNVDIYDTYCPNPPRTPETPAPPGPTPTPPPTLFPTNAPETPPPTITPLQQTYAGGFILSVNTWIFYTLAVITAFVFKCRESGAAFSTEDDRGYVAAEDGNNF